MSGEISLLRPTVANPATQPELTDALRASVTLKREQALARLTAAANELPAITFANSMGAEDMVLTDIILREKLAISIFSLDTGRLPVETYDLIAATEKHYNTKLVCLLVHAVMALLYA